MELRLLQYFLMVAQEENITKAAELLHLTQPTLSRQLAQLEKELGEKLFVRGRHFHLTETGVILRHQALEIVSMMDKLENDIHHHGEVAGNIRIGCGGLKCVQFLMRCMTEFQQEYPEVTFDLQNSNAVDIKEQLEHGTLDLGVMMEPVDTSSFDYIRMKDVDYWGLLMAADCPLAQKKYITEKDLKDLPIIVSNRQILRGELQHWLKGRLNIRATYNIITNVANVVREGYLKALTIDGVVSLYDPQKVVFRRLEPVLPATSVLAWKRFTPELHAVEKFLEFFRKKHDAYTPQD